MSGLPHPAAARRRVTCSGRAVEQGDGEPLAPFATARQSAPLPVRDLRALLREFETTFSHQTLELNQFKQHRGLLRGFTEIHHAWERGQIFVAEDFNVLRTMRLTTKELCHSDILAWLLDHRLNGFGSHSQGKCGFRLFLKALALPAEFADADYRVAREASGKDSRLDILIEADRNFIIGIENKVTSHEILGLEDGKDQTEREWADLERRGEALHVRHGRIRGLFLTPDNQTPRSSKFTPISWQQVADVFEAFAAEAKPKMVKLFAQHYAETLRQDVVVETEIE